MLLRMDFPRVASIVLVAAASAIASAQVRDVEPYLAVVTSPSANLHAGETDQFYRVGAVSSGVILYVDGETNGWARVAYPDGSFAFVGAEDATFNADTNEITLTRASRLRAPNPTSGFNGSWKTLLTTAIPAGTKMRALQVDEARGVGVVAYRVAMPEAGRAFLELRHIRRAGESEISAFRAKGGRVPEVKSAPAPATSSTSAPATPAAATSSASTPAPSAAPAATAATPAATPVAPDTSLVRPINTQGTAGAPAAASETASSAPAAAPSAPGDATSAASGGSPTVSTPVVIDQSATGAAPAAPVTTAAPTPSRAMQTAARLRELDGAFTRVNNQPLGEAEYESLIAEYERSIESLSGQLSERQRALLEQRLGILRFRKELRDKRAALLNESSSVQQQNQQVLQRITQVEATRVYTIVGQLQPSTVYNGQTLPLMYRIQSVGTSVPRTLGYIKPDPRFGLESKLGQIVGVIGESSIDKELRLNVIEAVRVDVLQGIPVPPAAQPAVEVPQAPSSSPAPSAPVALPDRSGIEPVK